MIKLAQAGEWKLMPPLKSQFHMYGENGEYNLKFVTIEGRFEAVYDINKELLTEETDLGAINMGTYNYKTPDNYLGHYLMDVRPWQVYGNIKNEAEKGQSKYNSNNEKMIEYYEKYNQLIKRNKS